MSEHLKRLCSVCGGDGKETCTNPDHGFMDAIGGDSARIGCPCCGNHPQRKVRNGGACEHCGGSGIEPEPVSVAKESVQILRELASLQSVPDGDDDAPLASVNARHLEKLKQKAMAALQRAGIEL